jgi:hypothetical protein
MMARKQQKKLDFDAERKKITIVTEKELDIEGDANEIRKEYRSRLRGIIQEVKVLKAEAEEIQKVLAELDAAEKGLGAQEA